MPAQVTYMSDFIDSSLYSITEGLWKISSPSSGTYDSALFVGAEVAFNAALLFAQLQLQLQLSVASAAF